MPADPRRHVLDAAARLFVARGYHAVSMREIAAAAGLSKAALYYHFRDKEALFVAILAANLEWVGDLVAGARRQLATARGQIGALVEWLLAAAPEQRAIIRLAGQEMAQLGPEARAEIARLYHERFTGQVEAILQAGVERGELRPLDVGAATWALLGMMYPFFNPAHERDPGPPERARALIVDLFFDGAGAEGDLYD